MRFTTRAVQDEDLVHIMRWRMLPEVTMYMNTNPKLTIEKQRKWFDDIKKKDTVKYWIVEVDGERAGVINLADINYRDKSTTWAYYIGEKKFRSLELAISLELSLYEYVFERMEMEEITGEVFSINTGVVKLHQICGCKIERIVEGEVEKDGIKYDVTHLKVTKREWVENRKKVKYQRIMFD